MEKLYLTHASRTSVVLLRLHARMREELQRQGIRPGLRLVVVGPYLG